MLRFLRRLKYLSKIAIWEIVAWKFVTFLNLSACVCFALKTASLKNYDEISNLHCLV